MLLPVKKVNLDSMYGVYNDASGIIILQFLLMLKTMNYNLKIVNGMK